MIFAAVSIDTEVDHHGDSWVKSSPLRFDSVIRGIPDVLTPLFEGLGVRPTYLLTTEVMDDAASVHRLLRLKSVELGTHLHGDHVAPAARVPDIAGSQSWDFTSCYPPELERAKLLTITQQFRDRFARAPTSYRAGRYAASGRTARFLSDLGYQVETSVTPRIRWVHEFQPGCELDFRRAPVDPYRPSESDLSCSGELPIWEVPITIVPAPGWRSAATMVYQRVRGLPVQPYPLWLRPSTTSWPWLRWIVLSRLRTRRPGDVTIFNIMFHSMEVVEDASPYSPDQRAARRIVKRLARLLGLLESVGARFMTLSELAMELERQQAEQR